MFELLFNNPLAFLIYLIALFLAITIHEFAHAWVTDQLGDPTARLAGRLKLNPRVHIDAVGFLFLFFFGFGWGKPVPFDPFNLKNPRRDSALISLAGPISNFILVLILAILWRIILFFFPFLSLNNLFSSLFFSIIQLNLILGIFNLIPIHPLDGFKIVAGFLPENQANEWLQLSKYGIFFLLLMIMPLGGSSMVDMIIKPIINFFLYLAIPQIAGSQII